MRRAAAHSAKDRALLPVLCVTEASFQCWLIGLKSHTELYDALPVMKTGSSPARFVSSDSTCCLIFLDLLSFEQNRPHQIVYAHPSSLARKLSFYGLVVKESLIDCQAFH